MFYLFLNTAFLDIIFVSIHNGFCYLLLQKCLETQPTATICKPPSLSAGSYNNQTKISNKNMLEILNAKATRTYFILSIHKKSKLCYSTK